MSNSILPGKYKINSIELISNIGSIDIRNLFLELNLFEDIFSNFITGSIALSDTNNLISGSNALPILGNELIHIDLDIPNIYQNSTEAKSNYSMSSIRFVGRITGIRERSIISEKNQGYILDFCAEEAITSKKIRVSKSYKGKEYYRIAQTIFGELASNSAADFEETKYCYNFICPNWNPMKAINWLASRSLSTKYSGASFLFYHKIYDESTQGKTSKPTDMFAFRSIENMLEGDIKKRVYFNPKNIEPYSDVSDMTRFSNIDAYNIVKSFNVIENLDSGMYSSKLITHDIINKSYSKTVFNYDLEFEKYKHLETGKLISAVPDAFGGRFPDYADATLRMYPKDNSMVTPSHIQEVVGSRLSILNSLNNFNIRFGIPGDGFSSPGDVIYFDIPSPEMVSAFDTFYSGKLLITSIRHHFRPEYYDMIFECAKDSLKVEPQNYHPSNNGVIGNYNG